MPALPAAIGGKDPGVADAKGQAVFSWTVAGRFIRRIPEFVDVLEGGAASAANSAPNSAADSASDSATHTVKPVEGVRVRVEVYPAPWKDEAFLAPRHGEAITAGASTGSFRSANPT